MWQEGEAKWKKEKRKEKKNGLGIFSGGVLSPREKERRRLG